MSNRNILSYGFVDLNNTDNVSFSFLGLLKVPEYCKEPEKCKITCLSYRRNENKEQIRKALQGEISNLNYVTINEDDFEKTRLESQRKIEHLTAKNYFNPFGKNKTRKERLKSLGLDVFYASPFIAGTITVLLAPVFLGPSLAPTVPSITATEFNRRDKISKEKSKIKNLEEKFRDSNNKFFCDLREIAPKLEVDTVCVDDAHICVENVKTLDFIELENRWGETHVRKNYNLFNAELNKIYKDYISQPKI